MCEQSTEQMLKIDNSTTIYEDIMNEIQWRDDDLKNLLLNKLRF